MKTLISLIGILSVSALVSGQAFLRLKIADSDTYLNDYFESASLRIEEEIRNNLMITFPFRNPIPCDVMMDININLNGTALPVVRNELCDPELQLLDSNLIQINPLVQFTNQVVASWAFVPEDEYVLMTIEAFVFRDIETNLLMTMRATGEIARSYMNAIIESNNISRG